MWRPPSQRARGWLALAALLIVPASAACDRPAAEPPRTAVPVSRTVGEWTGAGNRTIGIISDSGRFRITWEARDDDAARPGTFRLAVHSAVSGRPIQLITDSRGSDRGTAEVADDPRSYNLMVDAVSVQWSIAVEEIVAGYERR